VLLLCLFFSLLLFFPHVSMHWGFNCLTKCWWSPLEVQVCDLCYVCLCVCASRTPLMQKDSGFRLPSSSLLLSPSVYVTSISIWNMRHCACTLSPLCNGRPCGTHAFKHVCLNLCQCLVGKQHLCAPFLHPWIKIISPCKVGKAKRRVAPGGRGGGVASGPLTIHLHFSLESEFHIHFWVAPLLLRWKASGLLFTYWKRGSLGVLSQELTECLHRQLYTLPAGDDIMTSFYRPLEDESGETL